MVWFRARLTSVFEDVRSSFWFVPSLMMVGAVLLALVMVALDGALYEDAADAPYWVLAAGPEGSRLVLSTIATAMLGVAGVSFSVTMVVLSIASSQFGARLLRTFTRDLGNQLVLGTFVATFLYCLIVLRTVRGADLEDVDAFVPHLSVAVAMALALASVGVLIYFFDHVSQTIQAPRVVAIVGRELLHVVDAEYPARIEPLEPVEAPALVSLERDGRLVCARHSGYVRVVDLDSILDQAAARGLGVRVLLQVGDFVAEGEAVLRVGPGSEVDDKLLDVLAATVVTGANRSHEQDLRFPVDQLVEMAIRALSPSLNDPNTAAQCIDRLGEGLAVLASRPLPRSFLRRGEGWVYRPVPRMSHLLDSAFDRLRYYADQSEPFVLLRMLDALRRIARAVQRPEDEDAVRAHGKRLHEVALAGIAAPGPRREAVALYSDVERLLQVAH